ncbi:hypothetical protein B0T14DRAFT_560699 [Immersiella caudata]|uniref:Uncharacterized protein n=1 Tax=Immersiella caudata TaxID=314043 RepID=A0AA39XFK5_9PEZI|nr:hypothetical protein B0T14DRAFT_560699 [Immersiella caudata]
MQIKGIFTILAATASLAMAGDVEDVTLTSTSTMTRTVTITECNPTATDCPSGNWGKPNSTVSAHPTWYHKNESSWAVPTQKPTIIETAVVTAAPSKSKTPGAVETSGSNTLFVQSGLLLSLLGAGVALLA